MTKFFYNIKRCKTTDMKNLFLLSLLFIGGCNMRNSKHVQGNGNAKSEIRDKSGFNSIDVADDIDVALTQGSTYKVEVVAEPNLLPYIFTSLDGNTLSIHVQGGINIESSDVIKVKIQMPNVKKISVSGSGSVTSVGKIDNSDKLKLSISGSGNITMSIKTPDAEVGISGSGTANLNGETRDLKIHVSGSGDCLAEDLKSENAKVEIAGSGTAKLFASVKLDVSVAGNGNVFYGGNPTISQSIAGNGTIQKINPK